MSEDKDKAKTERKAGDNKPRIVRRPSPRPYPNFTLEKSLQLPLAIKENNAGNPWPPKELAKSLGIGEKSSQLDFYTRSALLYGLTSGSRTTAQITIERLGREIVYAPDQVTEIAAKQRAFLNVEIFAKVVEYYKGSNLPDLRFLANTLESEFALPPDLHDEFRSLFLQNCAYVEIGKEWNGIGSSNNRRREDSESSTILNLVAYHPTANSGGKRCFVIMPFTERFENRAHGFFTEVFESLIKPAAEAAGFDVQTAKREGSDVIQSTIINEIIDADIVVYDLTDHNPNVIFELGLRMAHEKAVAIIKSDDTGRIFDVDNLLRVFEYDSTLWLTSVKRDLPRLESHIRATWDNRDKHKSYISILRSN
jgi:hypothetical protein